MAFCKIVFLSYLTTKYFSTNFDITDESFSLYKYLKTTELENTCPVFLILNAIGSIWKHDIYIWRIVTLILIMGSTILNSSVIINYIFSDSKFRVCILEKTFLIQLVLIVSFCIFAWHPTLDYNLLPIIITSYWLSLSAIYLKSEKSLQRFILLFLLSFSIWLIFPIKFHFAILLLIVSTFTIFYKSKFRIKKDFIHFLIINIFSYLLLFFLHDLYFLHYITNISSSIKGSHSISLLFQKYTDDLINFFICCLFHPALMVTLFYSIPRSIFFKKFRQNQLIDTFFLIILLYICYSIISNPLLSYISEFSLNRNFYGIILTLSLILFYKVRRKVTVCFFQIIVLIFFIQFHAAGTNTVLFTITSLSVPSLFLVFILLLRLKTNNLIPFILISFFCFFYSASVLFKYQYSNYRRNYSHEYQIFNKCNSPILKNLKLEKDLGITINSITNKLNDLNFNSKKDYIWGFPDIPGIILALQSKSLGSSWNITGYANSDNLIKEQTLISLNEIQNDSNIYLLLDKNHSSSVTMLNFIENYITKKSNFTDCNVGTFYHHRNRNYFNCFLLGPYSRSHNEI